MRSLVEWALAIVLLVAVVRIGGPWVTRWAPRADAGPAADAEAPSTPPGVPAGARSVPLLVLLDGTEVRVGLSEARLRAVLSERLAAAPRVLSRGAFGDRVTRAYLAQGTRFWVVLERPGPGAGAQVSGIYLQ